jgi:hypothetical protein
MRYVFMVNIQHTVHPDSENTSGDIVSQKPFATFSNSFVDAGDGGNNFLLLYDFLFISLFLDLNSDVLLITALALTGVNTEKVVI